MYMFTYLYVYIYIDVKIQRKHPGIVTVMQALAVYRQARVHALGHSPKEFFNKEKDIAWLKVEKNVSSTTPMRAVPQPQRILAKFSGFLDLLPDPPGSLLASLKRCAC